MKHVIADGAHYFSASGLPVTVRRVRTDSEHSPAHPHDLTEIEHSHDFCELVIVAQGQATHCLEGNSFPVSAGDIFLLQGRQKHYFYNRHELDLINIMYDPAKIVLPENDLRKLPGYCAIFLLEPSYRQQHRFASRLHLNRAPLAIVEHLAATMDTECTDQPPGWEVAVRAKLLELMVFLARAYTTSDTIEAQALLRVGQVIGALEQNYAQDWTIDDLLQIAHMSRSNLMRTFHKATGQSPIDYLIRLRIQRAITLLSQSTLNVTEIAFAVGFKDSNYFTRQFKRIIGSSPRDFRSWQQE